MGFLDSVGNFMFGGDATNSINATPQHYTSATNALGQLATNAANQQAPQLATGQMDQSRGGLMGTANRLGAIASGQQAGAGEMAVNRQVGQATAAQTAAARMAQGANAALAARNAARNTANIGLQGAGQAQQAAASDQMTANGQLGQIYGQMYGQDANVAAQNANLQQQQTAQNTAAQIQAYGQQLGWDQATINAQIQKAQVAASDKGIIGGLVSGGGQALAAYATGGLSGLGQMAASGGGNKFNPDGLA
jgi:hypothetical protein